MELKSKLFWLNFKILQRLAGYSVKLTVDQQLDFKHQLQAII